jgi:hypothetical protein
MCVPTSNGRDSLYKPHCKSGCVLCAFVRAQRMLRKVFHKCIHIENCTRTLRESNYRARALRESELVRTALRLSTYLNLTLVKWRHGTILIVKLCASTFLHLTKCLLVFRTVMILQCCDLRHSFHLL